MKGFRFVVIIPMGLVLAAAVTRGESMRAQPAQDPALVEVRQTIDAARKEIETYRKAGGAAAVADHPAVKWDAALWGYREKYPRTDAAAQATAEAVRQLVRAELWDRAQARVVSLDVNDTAWERVAASVYEFGIARKNVPYTIEKLSRVAASTTSPAIKSAVLVVVGRAYRREGDKAAATRVLEEAIAAAPGTPRAEEAEGLIYEIKYLSTGLQAPAVAGKARNGGDIDLAALRGKPVVLVFWGTT
jgi:hypothetical protein